jgi:lipopolysaccharide/colanic/teichoic acid biosynthesis glycosyltransferase
MLTAPNQDKAGLILDPKRVAPEAANANSVDYFARQRFGRARAIDFELKRILDIVASFTILFVLAPVLLLVVAAILCESRGSPIFTQLRWGQGGRTIKIYKFRTMRSDAADPTGIKQTVLNDPRLTRFGAFLRRTDIDEIPQLYNVLRGDMSLVGPRCHAIGMLAGGVPYEQLVPRYHQRHVVRPGLTGLAQVRGLRGPTDRPSKARARVHADLFYIKHFSFVLDLRILVSTVWLEMTNGSGF